jgi:adenylate kinase
VGTLASAYYFRDLAEQGESLKYITLNGEPSVKDVTDELLSKL